MNTQNTQGFWSLSENARKEGFTLVEVIISMGVSAIFLAMATVTYVNFYRIFYTQLGYRDIHDDARKTVAIIDRDVRKCLSLANVGGFAYPNSVSSNFSTNFLGLFIPAATDGSQSQQYILYRTANKQVRGYDTPVAVLYRDVYTNTAGSPILSQQITRYPVNIDFSFFKDPGQRATTALVDDTVEVRTFLMISNQVMKTISTDRIQVRSKIRNKNIFN